MGSTRGSAQGIPDGLYAVPDPDRPRVLTMWSVRAGNLRDWPSGTRWRPWRPEYPKHLTTRQERREWADAWYSGTYFPWKDAVIEAIRADPEAAAAAFRRVNPDATLPAPPKRLPRSRPAPTSAKRLSPTQKRISEQRLIATALRAAGMSTSEIGRALDLPKTTAWRRIARERGTSPVGEVVATAMQSVRIGQLQDELVRRCETAGPGDAAEIKARLAQLQELRARLVARLDPGGRGPFGPVTPT